MGLFGLGFGKPLPTQSNSASKYRQLLSTMRINKAMPNFSPSLTKSPQSILYKAAKMAPRPAPAPAPAPLPAATGTSYGGNPGTYEQKVFNNAGQHAGTLHYKDGKMYSKSWVDDGQWKHTADLDHKYGHDRNYQALPGHHYGNINMTSAPESAKTGDGLIEALGEMFSNVNNEAKAVTDSFGSFIESMYQQMGEQSAGYRKDMQSMINTLMASQKAEESEPKVLGVKTAGDETPMTIKKKKQGVKGTFGREGLRIKGLNV